MAESAATESESITEEKEVETEKETTKESKDNNKDESTTETESNESKDNKVPETSKTSIPKEDSKPVEATSPQTTEAPQPVHTHNYNGVVTTQPTCTTPGIITYSCSCGDSYTENLSTTAHDFSVPVTQTVHHDEVWQNVPRQTTGSRVIICGCGTEFTSNDEWNAHCIANFDSQGPFCPCAGPYNVEDRPGETVYDYVKVSDAYDTEEIVGYECSVCGQIQ